MAPQVRKLEACGPATRKCLHASLRSVCARPTCLPCVPDTWFMPYRMSQPRFGSGTFQRTLSIINQYS